jgi:hypothetical protein
VLLDRYDLVVCGKKAAECFRVEWFDARAAIDLWSCFLGSKKL